MVSVLCYGLYGCPWKVPQVRSTSWGCVLRYSVLHILTTFSAQKVQAMAHTKCRLHSIIIECLLAPADSPTLDRFNGPNHTVLSSLKRNHQDQRKTPGAIPCFGASLFSFTVQGVSLTSCFLLFGSASRSFPRHSLVSIFQDTQGYQKPCSFSPFHFCYYIHTVNSRTGSRRFRTPRRIDRKPSDRLSKSKHPFNRSTFRTFPYRYRSSRGHISGHNKPPYTLPLLAAFQALFLSSPLCDCP